MLNFWESHFSLWCKSKAFVFVCVGIWRHSVKDYGYAAYAGVLACSTGWCYMYCTVGQILIGQEKGLQWSLPHRWKSTENHPSKHQKSCMRNCHSCLQLPSFVNSCFTSALHHHFGELCRWLEDQQEHNHGSPTELNSLLLNTNLISLYIYCCGPPHYWFLMQRPRGNEWPTLVLW